MLVIVKTFSYIRQSSEPLDIKTNIKKYLSSLKVPLTVRTRQKIDHELLKNLTENAQMLCCRGDQGIIDLSMDVEENSIFELADNTITFQHFLDAANAIFKFQTHSKSIALRRLNHIVATASQVIMDDRVKIERPERKKVMPLIRPERKDVFVIKDPDHDSTILTSILQVCH
jgi:hypothetical protein